MSKIRDGMCLVRIGSHRARDKLHRRFGRERQGYFKWRKQGEWREVTPEEMESLKEKPITGVKQANWDDELMRFWKTA